MEDEIYKKCVSTEEIYDILDGEASKELCDLFTEHIKTCEKCRQEYENIKRLETALRDCTSDPSPDFAKNTLARLKTVKRNPFMRITGHPAFKSATAAAACLILVFIVCSKGVFGTANEILDKQNYDEDIAMISTDRIANESDDYPIDAALYTAESDEVGANSATNGIDVLSDALEKDIFNSAEPEEPQANGAAVEESTEDSVHYYVVDEPEVEAESAESNTGEFVPPMAPTSSSAPTTDSELETKTTSGSTNSEVKSEVAVVPNASTSDSGPGNDVAVANPSSSDSGGGPQIENPMASDSGETVIENPIACDAIGAHTIPDYIYIPTVLVDKITITDAILTDNTSYYITTAEGIRFGIHEGDYAEFEYNSILEKCEDHSAEYADIIKEQQENYVPVEVAPGEPSCEPVEPMLPLDYGKPTVKELENGLYMDILKENDTNCSIYWYENGIFYKLSLPLEYIDGNEIQFKDLTLIENPTK